MNAGVPPVRARGSNAPAVAPEAFQVPAGVKLGRPSFPPNRGGGARTSGVSIPGAREYPGSARSSGPAGVGLPLRPLGSGVRSRRILGAGVWWAEPSGWRRGVPRAPVAALGPERRRSAPRRPVSCPSPFCALLCQSFGVSLYWGAIVSSRLALNVQGVPSLYFSGS